MKEIIEQYGIGMLQILGGLLAAGIWMQWFREGGILYEACLQYVHGICG